MKRSENDPTRRKTGEKADALAEEVSSMEGDTTAPEELASDAHAGDDGSGAADARAVVEEDRRLAEQHDKYLRLAAEYDNYRKRTARDSQLASQRGQGELLRGLLDAFDDLSRFAHVDPATTDTKTVVDGVALVERKVLKALSALGLEVINPVDQSFDPATMEAVTTEPALSPEDDHVVSRVFQVGYRFNGQLLRPARVAVKQWNG
jgi:molecular chaperone GrpE